MFSTGKAPSRIHIFAQKPDGFSDPLPDHGLLDLSVQNEIVQQFPEPDRPRLLEILQHFAAETIPTLSSGLEPRAAWQKALPVLTASHKFVTHSILAVGSLHLARLARTESEREAYNDIAATQMNSGMTKYRIEVQNVTTMNAEALFAFSTNLTTFVLLTANTDCKGALTSIKSDNPSAEDRLALVSALSGAVLRIFRSIRGVLVIIVPCWNHIREGTLQPVLEREWWPPRVPVTPEEVVQDRSLQRLETMWSRPGRTYDYSFDLLRQTLKSLRETFALVSRLLSLAQSNDSTCVSTFDWTSVIHWPVSLGVDFITLLEQRSVEAWVLIAHYAILPAKIKGILWLDGFASNLLTTAALVIGEHNWDWISWPAAAVDLDLKSLRHLTSVSPQTNMLSF